VKVDVNDGAAKFQSYFGVLLLVVYIVALIFWGGSWIRGSDQYWYLADVERLLSRGGLITNLYFPVKFLGPSEVQAAPNFVYHNGPMLHLSAFVGRLLGGFNAWISLNVGFHLLNASVIYVCASRYADRGNAILVTSFYIVSPIAIWQSLNMLQEQFFSAVMALVVFGYVFRQNLYARLVLIFGLLLGVISHPIFIILTLSYVVFVVTEGVKSRNIIAVIVGLLLLAVGIFLKSIANDMFPSSFLPDLKSLIAGSVPGESNMYWYMSDVSNSIDLELMKRKFLEAIRLQFFSIKTLPMFVFTNIALFGILFLIYRGWSKYKYIIIPAGIVLGAYVCMVLLMQNSPRYQQIVAPATFVVIAVLFKELNIKVGKLILIVCLFSFVLLATYLSYIVNRESQYERATVGVLREKLQEVTKNSNILVYESKLGQQLRFVLPDAKILRLKSKYLKKTSVNKILEKFKPAFIISHKSNLTSEFRNVKLLEKIDGMAYGELYWYRAGLEEAMDSRVILVD